MKKEPTIRIIINPTGVEKAQLLAGDQQSQQTGLKLYQKLHQEIFEFSERVNIILKSTDWNGR